MRDGPRGLAWSGPAELGELGDLVDDHRGPVPAQLALAQPEPVDQLLAGRGHQDRDGISALPQSCPVAGESAEPRYQVLLAFAFTWPHRGPQPVWCLDLGLVPGRHRVIELESWPPGLQHHVSAFQRSTWSRRRHCKKAVVDYATSWPVDPHDVVVVQVDEPGPVPRACPAPLAGAFGRDHIARHPQRDRAVEHPAPAVILLRLPDGDLIAEDPRRWVRAWGIASCPR